MHSRFACLLVILAFAVSCVGTVDTGQLEQSSYLDPAVGNFGYQGVLDARAISHDKIEVDFYPAGSGEDYVHELYVNDAANPVELQLETIKLLSGGLYRYVLQGLSINSAYKIKIKARNTVTGEVSEGEVAKVVRTFDNTTADFKGVARISPIPGSTSTSVKVDWNPASFIGAISATAYDPVYYMVTYISETGGPENLNNPDYTGADRFQVRVPAIGQVSPSNHPTEVNIQSLSPDTAYYFQVRAVHKSYNDFYNNDPNNIPVKTEQNSIYIEHITDPVGGAVDFDKQSLNVQKAPQTQVFTGLRANWSVGEGTYTHYRLFVKEFAGTDIENEDELPKSSLLITPPTNLNLPCSTVAEASGVVSINLPGAVKDDSSLIGCFDVPATVTNVQVNNLYPYTSYQLKVALCRDNNCDLQDGATNQGILSDIRHERTSPLLAPFDGINTISQPSDQLDQIKMSFNAFVTSEGYVNTMEVYCINPDDHNEYWKMHANGTAMSGTGTFCDGAVVSTSAGNDLSTVNSYSQLQAVNKLNITGITTINMDPAANYCFAISPAITGPLDAPEGDIRLAKSDWIIRCIQPELKLPNLEEFIGLEGTCQISEDTVTLGWSQPTGGLFDDYTLFYKQKDTQGFSFDAAKNLDPAYTRIQGITTLGTTVTGLIPGNTYQFGVLPTLDNAGTKLYSESNINTRECYVPLPKATFKEWTRAFAIGPKVDGRIPRKNYVSDDNDWPSIRTEELESGGLESRMYEAISAEGIPYEIPADQLNNIVNYFTNPPGEDNGDFSPIASETFDGALGASGVAASNTGIISIAWKDVELDFLESNFQTGQNTEDNDRSSREFGYRVYRSYDYGNSWENVGGDNLITAVDYSYRTRSDLSPVTERMGFFTDYSVKHLYELKNIARARIYLYKVVPVYAGKELSYNGSGGQGPNVIRVTLPPENMALVHRSMANRTMCMELGKWYEVSNNYVCDYNGLGAKPRGVPWQIGQTVIDLGGDLLVDRFELGCNYTRGALTSGQGTEYKAAASFFDLDGVLGVEGAGVISDNYQFNGVSRGGAMFRGCRAPYWGNYPSTEANTGNYITDESNPYGSSDPTYSDTIFGDCVGDNSVTMPGSFDADPLDLLTPGTTTIVVPGARDTTSGGGYDGTDNSDPDHPQWAMDYDASTPGLYGKDFRRNTVSQGEFAAVYYNKAQPTSSRVLPPVGPGFYKISDGAGLFSADYNVTQKCFINLASIGNDAEGAPWRARWFPSSMMNNVMVKNSDEVSLESDSRGEIASMTLGEISNSRGLYDDWRSDDNDKNFKAVPQSFWDLDRIHPDMPVARVFASNAAKLPPLASVDKGTLSNICASFKVQVGVGTDTGLFQPMGAPKSKRLIRRNESVMAGKYPEVLPNADITEIEAGNTAAVTLNGRSIASCNTGGKSFIDAQGTSVGSENRGHFPKSSLRASGPMLTGSGVTDGQDHTESCVSKFGAQDLAGNVGEVNSDEVFCDYDPDAMGIFFGEENDPGNSVVHPFTEPDEEEYYTSTNAYICFEEYPAGPQPADCPTCVWGDPDMDGTEMWCNSSGSYTIWKRVTSYAGYCSVVDAQSDKVDDALNFRSLAQIFEPIYNPDGSINSKPVSYPKSMDQKSVDSTRNGDGYFLNFGESNLGPSFKEGDSLSFTGPSAMYFNPIVGMPLTCANYGSRASCGTSAADNMEITLQSLWGNHNPSADPPGLSIDDYPVGNSGAANVGLSDVTGTTDSFVLGAPTNSNVSRIIVRGYIKHTNGSVTPVTENQGLSPENVFQLNWRLRRDEVLNLYSGGAYSWGDAGSFGLRVETIHRSKAIDVGSRCAIMINEGY